MRLPKQCGKTNHYCEDHKKVKPGLSMISHTGKRSNWEYSFSNEVQEMHPSKKRRAIGTCSPNSVRPQEQHNHSNEVEFNDLPHEVLSAVLSFLDVESLLSIRLASRCFLKLASGESVGWRDQCRRLWSTKVHVCPAARAHPNPMSAFRLSLEDARHRSHISMEELLYNPLTNSGTVWSFRFKEAAGRDWQEADPWYNHQPCRKLVFLADGWVKEFRPAADSQPNDPPFPFHDIDGDIIDTQSPMKWRLVTTPIDLPRKQPGSYIRVSVGGRDVPTYCVRRSPTNNWGFAMESCWGFMASFEPPSRPGRNMRRHQVGSRQPLVDEESFEVTTSLQWREAFLYNFGAHVFPNGDDPVASFRDEHELETLLND